MWDVGSAICLFFGFYIVNVKLSNRPFSKRLRTEMWDRKKAKISIADQIKAVVVVATEN